MAVREEPLTCPLCHNHPRLAGFGVDADGRLFVHIMVYKANQMKADVYVNGGTVTLMCYKCHRYHTIRISDSKPRLVCSRPPNLEAQRDIPTPTIDPLHPFHLE